MRVLTQRTIANFCSKHPNDASGIRSWMTVMKTSNLRSFAELRDVFGSKVDKIAHCYVFDVGGNNLRLIVKIVKMNVFIKGLYTHAQYSKDTWYGDCNCAKK